jgi:hypothetical protein
MLHHVLYSHRHFGGGVPHFWAPPFLQMDSHQHGSDGFFVNSPCTIQQHIYVYVCVYIYIIIYIYICMIIYVSIWKIPSETHGILHSLWYAAGQINASAVRRAALATFILAQAVSVGMRHIAWAGECDATKSEVGQPQIWRFIESILCKPL